MEITTSLSSTKINNKINRWPHFCHIITRRRTKRKRATDRIYTDHRTYFLHHSSMISTSLSLTSDYYSGSDLSYDNDDDDVVKAAPQHHHTFKQTNILLQTLLQQHHHHPSSSLPSTIRLHHSFTLLKVIISSSFFLSSSFSPQLVVERVWSFWWDLHSSKCYSSQFSSFDFH